MPDLTDEAMQWEDLRAQRRHWRWLNDNAELARRRQVRNPKPNVKAFLNSPSVAAQRLGVTVEQLFGFVHDGELRYVNVGRGSKRQRYAFTDDDINELIEQRKTREVACPSTSPKSRRHISGTTSKSVVVGFTARRAQQLAAKRKK